MPTLAETSDDRTVVIPRGGAIVELVTGAAGEWLGEPPAPTPESAESAESAEMLRAIREWIEERLPDPALSPAVIAAAHHISVRQLYRVFRPAGTTVARYVRARRLENCRRELSDPFLGTERIGAIADRWGLPDAAAFSRAFRAAYGQTPTACRARATGLRRDDRRTREMPVSPASIPGSGERGEDDGKGDAVMPRPGGREDDAERREPRTGPEGKRRGSR
ncbi:helix-turn-helix domain-containing protein [Actinomadura latina]|uniref:Helix-turn-helix domain-containing protein n=1 Tax=Actinomadura latina TaxID=163603 RepID=A0A846Z9X7_9ACTN|nr:helix-turn-helix domain-containing protein [Actinomadura latina]NKZ06826.1 helix-turn-helix domain-containing protein [Actinomadura latina]